MLVALTKERLALGAIALSLVTAVGLACLPDLEVIPPIAPPPPTCGDGIVDLDRGEQCDPGDAGPKGANGCTSGCLVDCDGGFIDPKTAHCYYWATSATSKDFAEHFCGGPPNGGHLVTFTSPEELAFVVAQAQGPKVRNAPDAAIGYAAWSALRLAGPLNDDSGMTPSYINDGELGWGRDCTGCWARIDDPDATVFPPRFDGGSTGECASWNRSTKPPWYTSVCDLAQAVRPVLCEREPVGDFTRLCPDGTCISLGFTSGKKSYVVVRTPTAPDVAQSNCQKLNGRLVVLATREEREELFAAIEGLGVIDTWIGLSRDSATSPWKWEDGSDLSKYPLPWGDLEPRATDFARAYVTIDRARYDTRAAHAIDDSTAMRAYICER